MDVNQHDGPYPSNIYQERQRLSKYFAANLQITNLQNDFVYPYFAKLIDKYRKRVVIEPRKFV